MVRAALLAIASTRLSPRRPPPEMPGIFAYHDGHCWPAGVAPVTGAEGRGRPARAFRISKADSRSTAFSYTPATTEVFINGLRRSGVICPIWLCGGQIYARS